MKSFPVDSPPVQGFSKLNDYQRDFLHLTTLVSEVFPLPDRSFPRNARTSLEQEILEQLGRNPGDRAGFLLALDRYLAGFSNQHARVVDNPEPVRFTNIYPFMVHHVGAQLFVSDVAQGQEYSLIGKQITAIQDRPVAEVERKLSEFVSAENDWTKRTALEQPPFLYSRPLFHHLIGSIPSPASRIKLDFADHPPVWFEPAIENQLHWQRTPVPPNPITARTSHPYDLQIFSPQNLAYFQFNACFDRTAILDGLNMVRPWLRPLVRAWLGIQFRREKPSSMLSGIYDPSRPVFKDYLSSAIREIQRAGITNLIIDLRGNAGGEFELTKQLVYHLTSRNDLRDSRAYYYNSAVLEYYDPERSKTFRHWYRRKFGNEPASGQLLPAGEEEHTFFAKVTSPGSPYHVDASRPVFVGNIFLLVNQNTGSAASILAGLMQDNQLAVIVGTTTGNNPTGPTAMTPFRLPHSGLMVSLPTEYRERAVPSRGEMLKPDIWVENTVSDLLNGRDAAFEKSLELIGIEAGNIMPPRSEGIQSALDFLKDLKQSDNLPGWSRDQKGEVNLEAYSFFLPQTVTFTAGKRGENNDSHYTLTRDSKSQAWQLKRAWRTNRNGRFIDNYPVPVPTTSDSIRMPPFRN